MRNGSGSGVRRIGRGPDRNKRIHGSAVRAFFAALILLAAGLSALAVYLSAQVDRHRNNNRNGGSGSGSGGRSRGGATPVVAKDWSINPVPGATRNDEPPKNNKNDINAGSKKSIATKEGRLPYPAGPKTDAKYANDRVYCMVPYVWNRDFYDAIMSTWGRRCDVINFLTDAIVKSGGKVVGDEVHEDPEGGGHKHHSEFPEGTFPDNVHFVNMTRPWTGCKDGRTKKPKVCRHIWEKMWRSWVYVGDNHLDQAEWFCKVDYDTFFFPENLQYYVRDYKGWDPYDEYHYFGTVLKHQPGRPPMVAGAAACWSRKTLRDIVRVYKDMPKGWEGTDRYRCEDRRAASEEISTSMCLKKELGVDAEEMLDEEQREYVMLDPYHNMLTWNRTEQGEWWFWQNKPANRGQGENCCAVRPMGFHKYKALWWMKLLEEQFYGPTNNKEVTKLNERTRGYVEKVRRAMGIDQ